MVLWSGQPTPTSIATCICMYIHEYVHKGGAQKVILNKKMLLFVTTLKYYIKCAH